MRSYARLVLLLAAVFVANAAVSQDKETQQAQTAASEEGAVSRAEHCWPTRNVGIAETSKDYYASCKAQNTGGEATQQ